MYKVYDKQESIRRIQKYLMTEGDPKIFVAPTGIFDENTRLSVVAFQNANGLSQSGIVDKKTFDLLYSNFILNKKRNEINELTDSFIMFPLYQGDIFDEMFHINLIIENILNYHRKTHNVMPTRSYSASTAEGIRILREIFIMDDKDYIDEVLYSRMIDEHDSIAEINNNF